MAIELLEQVRAAEEKAEGIRREAAEQAREIVKSVEEATLEAARQTAAEIRAAYQDRMRACQAGVDKRIADRAGEKQTALEELARHARTRTSQAAALIVERVLRDGNH